MFHIEDEKEDPSFERNIIEDDYAEGNEGEGSPYFKGL
jgi:hypothetical protein